MILWLYSFELDGSRHPRCHPVQSDFPNTVGGFNFSHGPSNFSLFAALARVTITKAVCFMLRYILVVSHFKLCVFWLQSLFVSVNSESPFACLRCYLNPERYFLSFRESLRLILATTNSCVSPNPSSYLCFWLLQKVLAGCC